MNNITDLLSPMLVSYYREHPDKFIEEILGIKLEPYQKKLLKLLYEDEDD